VKKIPYPIREKERNAGKIINEIAETKAVFSSKISFPTKKTRRNDIVLKTRGINLATKKLAPNILNINPKKKSWNGGCAKKKSLYGMFPEIKTFAALK
jgi:hypothetical protein